MPLIALLIRPNKADCTAERGNRWFILTEFSKRWSSFHSTPPFNVLAMRVWHVSRRLVAMHLRNVIPQTASDCFLSSNNSIILKVFNQR
jgi:hypothetical protein